MLTLLPCWVFSAELQVRVPLLCPRLRDELARLPLGWENGAVQSLGKPMYGQQIGASFARWLSFDRQYVCEVRKPGQPRFSCREDVS